VPSDLLWSALQTEAWTVADAILNFGHERLKTTHSRLTDVVVNSFTLWPVLLMKYEFKVTIRYGVR
jgi:hypothetical protein